MNQVNLKAAGGFSADAQQIFDAHEKQMLPMLVKSLRTKDKTFSELCQFFAGARRAIATKAGSEEADLFGKPRKSEPKLEVTDLRPTTDKALYEIYQKDFVGYLSTGATEHSCDYGKSVFSKQHVSYYSNSGETTFKAGLSARDIRDVTCLCGHVTKLYERSSPLCYKYGNLCNDKKLGQITIRNYVTCDGADIEATSVRGLVEMHSSEDTSVKVIDRLNDSVYMLTHTPSENIDTLVNEAEKHWLAAKHCSVESDSSLFKSHIASMYWYFSHAMPYIRGSEAIAKWLVELSVQCQGHTIVYPPDYVYRMPFGIKLDEFRNYFEHNVDLLLSVD